MIRIQVRPNEPLEGALRRFKRQCNYAGIFRLAKKASVYEKPSERRRREARERIRNVQRALRKAAQAKRGRRKPPRRHSPRQSESSDTKQIEAEKAEATSSEPAKVSASNES